MDSKQQRCQPAEEYYIFFAGEQRQHIIYGIFLREEYSPVGACPIERAGREYWVGICASFIRQSGSAYTDSSVCSKNQFEHHADHGGMELQPDIGEPD